MAYKSLYESLYGRGGQAQPDQLAEVNQDIINAAIRLNAVGQPLPERGERPGALSYIFRGLNVPGTAVRGLLTESLDKQRGINWDRLLEGLWSNQDRYSGLELLKTLGLDTTDDPTTKWDDVGRGVANFFVEGFTDPFSWAAGGIARGLRVSAPFVGKGIQLTSRGLLQGPIEAAGRAISRSPVGEAVGKMFVAGRNLPEEYRAAMTNFSNRVRRLQGEALQQVANLTRGLSDEEGKAVVDIIEGLEPAITNERVTSAAQGLGQMLRQIGDEEVQRGIISTLRDNYFPHFTEASRAKREFGVVKPLSARDPSAMKRKYEGPLRELADQVGFVYEPGAPAAARLIRGIRARETFDFVQSVLNRTDDAGKPMWGVTRDKAVEMALEQSPELAQRLGQWADNPSVLDKAKESVARDWAKAMGLVEWKPKGGLESLGTHYVDPAIAADLDRVVRFYTDDESIRTFLRWWDKGTSVWKRLVTMYRPSFHINNWIGNLWNMYLGGFRNPTRLVDAARILSGDEVEFGVKALGRKLNTQQIRELALDHGILNAGFLTEGLYGNAMDVAKEYLARGPVGKVKRAVRLAGTAVEDHSRLTLFLDRLAKGDTPEQAAIMVNKYLFDYSPAGFTTLENAVLRKVIPFYSWTRKNIPLQVAELAKQPGKFLGFDRARRSVEMMSPDDKDEERPAWLREAVRLPWQLNGQNLYYNPRLPLQDIQRIPGLAGDSGRGLLGNVHPAIKLMFELPGNVDLYTGRAIEQYEGQTVPYQFGPWETRLPAKAAHTLRNFGVLNLAGDVPRAMAEEGSLTDALRVARNIFPGLYTVDPERARLNEAYEYRQRLYDLMRKYREETGREIPTVAELRRMGLMQ